MEEALKILVKSLAEKADATILTLMIVIGVLSFLLIKALGRIDALSTDLAKNSQTLAKLTVLIQRLVYGRDKT